jgi:hypothetical protein
MRLQALLDGDESLDVEELRQAIGEATVARVALLTQVDQRRRLMAELRGKGRDAEAGALEVETRTLQRNVRRIEWAMLAARERVGTVARNSMEALP